MTLYIYHARHCESYGQYHKRPMCLVFERPRLSDSTRQRVYVALVAGVPAPAEGRLAAPLAPDPKVRGWLVVGVV
jgi:hypothetical protein